MNHWAVFHHNSRESSVLFHWKYLFLLSSFLLGPASLMPGSIGLAGVSGTKLPVSCCAVSGEHRAMLPLRENMRPQRLLWGFKPGMSCCKAVELTLKPHWGDIGRDKAANKPTQVNSSLVTFICRLQLKTTELVKVLSCGKSAEKRFSHNIKIARKMTVRAALT